MAKPQKITVSLAWKDKKCLRALGVILRTLQDVSEDFDYRDDVQRAARAAKYLMKHVTVAVEDV